MASAEKRDPDASRGVTPAAQAARYFTPVDCGMIACVIRGGIVVWVLVLLSSLANAQEKPWAKGVPQSVQTQVQERFKKGNTYFEERQYKEALVEYQDAVKKWDHPAIHFNIAVCLINLDRPVEAYEHLRKGMAYGDAPLGKEIHGQGLTYQKLLEGRLSWLEVSTTQAGILITLDGKDLLTGPGKTKVLLLPGDHQLVAKQVNGSELSPMAKKINLDAGATATEEVFLIPPKPPVVRMERRWRTWVPWAVTGGGVAVGLLGAGLTTLAKSDFKSYDNDIAELCPMGCQGDEIPGALKSVESRARLERGLGIGFIAAGGAAVAAGLTLIILNQPRAVTKEQPIFSPSIDSDGVKATLTLSF
jgi:hypothetical protein